MHRRANEVGKRGPRSRGKAMQEELPAENRGDKRPVSPKNWRARAQSSPTDRTPALVHGARGRRGWRGGAGHHRCVRRGQEVLSGVSLVRAAVGASDGRHPMTAGLQRPRTRRRGSKGAASGRAVPGARRAGCGQICAARNQAIRALRGRASASSYPPRTCTTTARSEQHASRVCTGRGGTVGRRGKESNNERE